MTPRRTLPGLFLDSCFPPEPPGRYLHVSAHSPVTENKIYGFKDRSPSVPYLREYRFLPLKATFFSPFLLFMEMGSVSAPHLFLVEQCAEVVAGSNDADWNVDELNRLHWLDRNVDPQFVTINTLWSVVGFVADHDEVVKTAETNKVS